MSQRIHHAFALATFLAMVVWASPASAQLFEIVDPVLDGNVSDLDYGFGDRPLTLEEGRIEASAHLAHARFDTGFFDLDFTTLQLNGSYGVTSDLEVGLATYLGLDPEFEWSESLAPRAVYNFLKAGEGSPIDLAFDAQLVLNFNDGADLLPFAVIGAPLRLKINDQLYVLAGQNAITLGIEADILNVAANGAIVYLPTPELMLRLDTQVLNLALRDGDSSVILFDVTPLALSAIYKIAPMLDVTVGLTFPDIGEGADFLFLTAGILSRF